MVSLRSACHSSDGHHTISWTYCKTHTLVIPRSQALIAGASFQSRRTVHRQRELPASRSLRVGYRATLAPKLEP